MGPLFGPFLGPFLDPFLSPNPVYARVNGPKRGPKVVQKRPKNGFSRIWAPKKGFRLFITGFGVWGPLLDHFWAQKGVHFGAHFGPLFGPLLGPNHVKPYSNWPGPVQKGVQKWSKKWAKMGPLFDPYGPQKGSKMGPKWTHFWAQIGFK